MPRSTPSPDPAAAGGADHCDTSDCAGLPVSRRRRGEQGQGAADRHRKHRRAGPTAVEQAAGRRGHCVPGDHERQEQRRRQQSVAVHLSGQREAGERQHRAGGEVGAEGGAHPRAARVLVEQGHRRPADRRRRAAGTGDHPRHDERGRGGPRPPPQDREAGADQHRHGDGRGEPARRKQRDGEHPEGDSGQPADQRPADARPVGVAVLPAEHEQRVRRREQQERHGHERRVEQHQQRRGHEREPEPDGALHQRAERDDESSEDDHHDVPLCRTAASAQAEAADVRAGDAEHAALVLEVHERDAAGGGGPLPVRHAAADQHPGHDVLRVAGRDVPPASRLCTQIRVQPLSRAPVTCTGELFDLGQFALMST